MKINNMRGLVAGGIASMMMLIAPAAQAASMVSVDGPTAPGQVTMMAVNMGMTSFNTTGNIPSSCTVSSAVGKINRGVSATSGSVIGQIDHLAFGTAGTPCSTTTLGPPIVIEKAANPTAPAARDIEFTATPAKGSATTRIAIREVSLKVHATGNPPWVYDMKLEGDLEGAFNQTTQQVTINTPPSFPLDITTFNGAGTDTPAQHMAGPRHAHSDVKHDWLVLAQHPPDAGGIHW